MVDTGMLAGIGKFVPHKFFFGSFGLLFCGWGFRFLDFGLGMSFLGRIVEDSCWLCRVLGKSLRWTSVLIFALRMPATCRAIICTVSHFPTRL